MSAYSVTAQYYDALMSVSHAAVDRQITAALENLDVTVGPVLDIGAGTGLSTALIASALPESEILAIEPDPAMRTALMTRVCADETLSRQVSILPFDLFSAPLPERIAAAVLSASLVHFSVQERKRLWTLLADRLAPSGRIIVEVQCPEATNIPAMDMEAVQIGRLTYRATASAERIAPDRQRWTMSYRSLLDNHEIACDSTQYDCWTAGPETVLAEAAAAGLDGCSTENIVELQRRD